MPEVGRVTMSNVVISSDLWGAELAQRYYYSSTVTEGIPMERQALSIMLTFSLTSIEDGDSRLATISDEIQTNTSD